MHILYKTKDCFGDAASYGFCSEQYPGWEVRAPTLKKLAKAVARMYPTLDMLNLEGDSTGISNGEETYRANILEVGLFRGRYREQKFNCE